MSEEQLDLFCEHRAWHPGMPAGPCRYCDGTATIPANDEEDPVNVVVFKWSKPGYRSQFTSEYVNVFASMLARNSTVPYRLLCITDDAEGLDSSIQPVELWPCPVPAYGGGNVPNCFRRLFMFSDDITEALGPRWIWSDLDCVITGNVDHILRFDADFRIWRPDGGSSKCNGSLVCHRAGTRRELWTEFMEGEVVGSVEEFRAQTNHLGSDQAWMGSRLRVDDQFWEEKDGVYAFRKLRNHYAERAASKAEKEEYRAPRTATRYTRDASRRSRHAARRERMERRKDERLATPLPPNARLVYFPGQQHPWDARVQQLYPWVKQHWT